LKEKGVNKEFTHVASPEENVYIEALHSNIQREIVERFEFESVYHAQMIFNRYYEWYNYHRKHRPLDRNLLNNTSAKINLFPDHIKLKK
jgi:transposase InsO family protein